MNKEKRQPNFFTWLRENVIIFDFIEENIKAKEVLSQLSERELKDLEKSIEEEANAKKAKRKEKLDKLWSFRKEIVLLIYAFAVAYVCFFHVPWILSDENTDYQRLIYETIWWYHNSTNLGIKIDASRIWVQLVAISIIASVAYKLIGRNKESG